MLRDVEDSRCGGLASSLSRHLPSAVIERVEPSEVVSARVASNSVVNLVALNIAVSVSKSFVVSEVVKSLDLHVLSDYK